MRAAWDSMTRGKKKNALSKMECRGTNNLDMVPGSGVIGRRGLAGGVAQMPGGDTTQIRQEAGNLLTDEQYQLNHGQNTRTLAEQRENRQNYQDRIDASINQNADATIGAIQKGASISAGATRQVAGIQTQGINQAYNLKLKADDVTFAGRNEAALINKTSAEEAARLRMAETVMTGFFRDLDRRLEEMKPKY